jgi:hypothetical protein
MDRRRKLLEEEFHPKEKQRQATSNHHAYSTREEKAVPAVARDYASAYSSDLSWQ